MKARIRAGELRNILALGRPVVTRDATGAEVVSSWEERDVFGEIEPLTGREFLMGGMLKDSISARVLIRHSPSWMPSARWRVRDRVTGAVFNVAAVMVHPAGAVVELMVTALPSSGVDGR